MFQFKIPVIFKPQVALDLTMCYIKVWIAQMRFLKVLWCAQSNRVTNSQTTCHSHLKTQIPFSDTISNKWNIAKPWRDTQSIYNAHRRQTKPPCDTIHSQTVSWIGQELRPYSGETLTNLDTGYTSEHTTLSHSSPDNKIHNTPKSATFFNEMPTKINKEHKLLFADKTYISLSNKVHNYSKAESFFTNMKF